MKTRSLTHPCLKCGNQTSKVIRIKEGEHLCYACYCSRCNADGKEKHHRDEAKIQTEFFCKVKLFFPKIPDSLLFAVPNGGSRNKIEAANLKRQGVKPGVADVLLLIPASGYGCLSIEFKTPRGRQSLSQREFQRQVEKAGNRYVICRSVTDALMAISEYLNVNPIIKNDHGID